MTRCPNGHESAADDYCDTCGIRIGTAPAGSPLPAGEGAPVSAPSTGPAPPGGVAPEVSPGDCTNCGAARTGSERFCELCGLDFETGAMPAAPTVTPAQPTPSARAASTALLAAGSGSGSGSVPGSAAGSVPGLSSAVPAVLAPQPPGIGWAAVISCDRQWWEDNSGAGGVADGVPYPDPQPQPRRMELRASQSVIGRSSGSTVPDIDCGTLDTGVSRRHARLALDDSGQWTVRDLGSTNGTYLGDGGERLEADVDTAFDPSSTIKLGAFTVLALEQVDPASP